MRPGSSGITMKSRLQVSAGRAVRTGGAAAVLCLFATTGCASLPPAEQRMLIEASQKCTQGDIAAASASLDRLIRDYDHTPEIAEAYYLRGLCRFISQQPRGAREDFERGISKSTRSDLTARCRASLATIAFQSGDWARAADLYQQSVGELPESPPTDVVLYNAGLAMQRAGRWRDANLQFARILNRFRDRPVAADARRMAAWRHPYYSVQLGAYRDADNAGRAVQTLRQQGLDAVQEYLPRNQQSLWIVMAGRYQSYNDARAAVLNIRQRQPDATIIP